MREGWGKCLKYLERGWNRKEGRGHKDFKKAPLLFKDGSRGGCFKGGGSGTPMYYIYNHMVLIFHLIKLGNHTSISHEF